MVGISEVFTYKAKHSPRFHSAGIAGLLEFDLMLMAVSKCSVCETLYIFS